MTRRNQRILPLLVQFTLIALAILTFAGQAWSQCSITSSGACSGTCPKGQVCKSDGKDSYSCSCQPANSMSPLGDLFNAGGGTIAFNGSSLTVSGLTVTDVFDKFNGNFVPGDPIIGASVIFPTMTFNGLHTFNNGVTQFQYFDFQNLSGGKFQVVNGSTVYLSADIDDTWYFLNSQSFSGNDLTNIVYNQSVNSNFLSSLKLYSSMAQPATVVASGSNFGAGSSNFTQSFSTTATDMTSECANTPEPGTWMLGLGAIAVVWTERRMRLRKR